MRESTGSRGESGFTLLELSAALAIIAVLVVVAIASFAGVRRQSVETAAQAELRDALAPLKAHLMDGDPSLSLDAGVHAFAGGIRFDDAAIGGIRLERATDGAVCMWRIAETGSVYGTWTSSSGGETLFTEQASLPSACPEQTTASGAGFGPSW
ncbi:MAG: prepilin-type N-terminal cleavage/methylation domain-containing protein [Actinobacteria bacterium]|nr:MAG: prepilin-type N-terminal cleavage/methylation domain-containing protein [Actinomycetota bacterium]